MACFSEKKHAEGFSRVREKLKMEPCPELNLARCEDDRIINRRRRSEARIISQHAGREIDAGCSDIRRIHSSHIRAIKDVESLCE